MDAFWLQMNTNFVFLMQLGFLMLEIGSVRAQHAKAICTKNSIDFLITTFCWLCVGYGIAFGGGADGHYLVGTDNYFSTNMSTKMWSNWFFQWSFASAAATIVSGAGAERMSFQGYLLSTVFINTVVYPPVVHWVWSEKNWLSDGSAGIYFVDYAGCGVVHMVGGTAGLAIAIALGPRDGRFDAHGDGNALAPHNLVLAAAGGLLLVCGWFGFNGGSTLQASGGNASLAARVCGITAIGAAGAGLSAFIFTYWRTGFIKLEVLVNGVLAGCVSVTAGANIFLPGAAVAAGIVGGILYCLLSDALVYFKIDDPLDASPIHLGCGLWGLIAVGLFASEEGKSGLLLGNGEQFGYQLFGAFIIFSWTMSTCGLLYYICNRISTTILRVPLDIELAGDLILYGGSAYPQFTKEVCPPEGHVAVVITDVEGSTALWEWDAEVMKEAIVVQEEILRRNITRFDGYELGDEGDSLAVVFHDIFAATRFALVSQQDMMMAPWPEKLYSHPNGAREGTLWCGLRVRMAVDVGHSTKFLNKVTQRLNYRGQAPEQCAAILKAIEGGGIVVASTNSLQELNQKHSHRLYELGAYDIQDLGTYRFPKVEHSLSLIQIMPSELNGRPATSFTYTDRIALPYALAPGVFDPMCERPAIAFVFCAFCSSTAQKGEAYTAMLSEFVIQAASATNGYVTKDSSGVFLLAFNNGDAAMAFAIECRTKMGEAAYVSEGLEFKAGVHVGIPTSVSPNKASGRADYLGPPVNTAARLLALAGDKKELFQQQNVAVAVGSSAWINIAPLTRAASLKSAGFFHLKGVADKVEVFAYHPSGESRAGTRPPSTKSSRPPSTRSSRLASTKTSASPRLGSNGVSTSRVEKISPIQEEEPGTEGATPVKAGLPTVEESESEVAGAGVMPLDDDMVTRPASRPPPLPLELEDSTTPHVSET